MKHLICSLLLIVGTGRLSAQPVIDSLSIDPTLGQLVVHGKFDVKEGSVTIDGIALDVLDWQTKGIACSIRDTGRGSAGPVIVTDATGVAEAHNLSDLTCSNRQSHDERHSRDSGYGSGADLHLRFDLHSLLQWRRNSGSLKIDTQSFVYISRYWGTQWSPEYGYETEAVTNGKVRARNDDNYVAGFRGQAFFYLNEKLLSLELNGIRGIPTQTTGSDRSTYGTTTAEGFRIYIQLDDNLQPVHIDTGYSSNYGLYYDALSQKGSLSFAPPPGLIVLLRKPTRLASEQILRDQFCLSWTKLPAIDLYTVQFSQDQQFTDGLHETYSSDSLAFVRPGAPGTYYWRVKGKTKFGETDWSTVASFDVEGSNSVGSDEGIEYSISDQVLHYSVGDQKVQVRCSDLMGRDAHLAVITGSGEMDLHSYTSPMILCIENGGSQKRLLIR